MHFSKFDSIYLFLLKRPISSNSQKWLKPSFYHHIQYNFLAIFQNTFFFTISVQLLTLIVIKTLWISDWHWGWEEGMIKVTKKKRKQDSRQWRVCCSPYLLCVVWGWTCYWEISPLLSVLNPHPPFTFPRRQPSATRPAFLGFRKLSDFLYNYQLIELLLLT